MNASSNLRQRQLVRHTVGELPLIQFIADKIGLKELFEEFIPQSTREEVAPSDALMFLVFNLTMGKTPLYELNSWTRSLDLQGLGYSYLDPASLTDDRFARALDRLFQADRASLMTNIVVRMIKMFNIDTDRLHNDSTTVTAFGEYPLGASNGFALKKGRSKNHRPDLKQLLFSLTVSADGAVPVHQKSYPGNFADEKTHIETWTMLRGIAQRPDFLYVADCKLCSDALLSHIVEQGGRVVTVMPNSWGEVDAFRKLRKEQPGLRKKLICRKQVGDGERINCFYEFKGEYLSRKRGYRIHWMYTTEEAKRQKSAREERLQRAENDLRDLLAKLNQRKLKTEEHP